MVDEDIAPVYRYYTVDLLSNRILAEIPFRAVTWGRALKDAGTFEGTIPVIPQTEQYDLYNSTAPGVTALYVVRDNICVWGGIIWARQYDAVSKDLQVSGSEFTSYLHHRFIWKTWNHEYGATVVIDGDSGTVVFDYGSNTKVNAGSSVHLEFYEPENFKYNGYYRVTADPAPTLSGFSLIGGYSVADVTSIERTADVAYYYTSSEHGFNDGDQITVSGTGTEFDGTFIIGLTASAATNVFTVTNIGSDVTRMTVSGTAERPVPSGTYQEVTVTVRSDTYDYVRNLLDSAFADFVGTDFPNAYIEPGISYGINIIQSQLGGGIATITTQEDHNLSVGQAVQVQDLSPQFDGEYAVTATPYPNVFSYQESGTQAATPVTANDQIVISAGAIGNVVTMTTESDHGFLVGQNVQVFCGYDADPDGSILNGTFPITAIYSPTKFSYAVLSPLTIPTTTFTAATAAVGATTVNVAASKLVSNVATLTTEDEHGFSVGDSVTVAGVDHVVPIQQKSLDAANSIATIVTAVPHELPTGSSVTISGLRDTANIVQKSASTSAVTFTTLPAHNFTVGDEVTIENMVDSYIIVSKSQTSGVVTLTTSGDHNIPGGSTITVDSVYDVNTVTARSLTDGEVTLTIGTHNYSANDSISVAGISEVGNIVATEMVNGIAILTLSSIHNFQETQNITVAGIGAPFDGDFTVLSYTDTRVLYQMEDDTTTTLAPVARSSGTVTSADSIYNGDFYLSAVGSGTVSYNVPGMNATVRSVSGTVTGWSPANGVYGVSNVPSSTTLQYALAGNDLATAVLPQPTDDESTPPNVYTDSRHLGSRTITAADRFHFTFSQVATYAESLRDTSGTATADSIFNGVHTITTISDDTFTFPLSNPSNVLEESANILSFVTASDIYNGTFIISDVPDDFTFRFAKTHTDLEPKTIYGLGEATVQPMAVVSTYGPYPGNASIGIEYSTRNYSGVNVEPVAYRGFELTNLGDALDTYSSTINGFEYRIDCSYDQEWGTFRKTFVLLPINFPDPPAQGEASPPSRFGADKLVFEFPGGSITTLSLQESAEDSTTRFFAQGSTDLGPDAGPQSSVAAAMDLLAGSRRWPLLDGTEKIDGVDDETLLYSYAQKYLSQTRPPGAALSVSVNGSIPPLVGSYSPGDWCSLIIDDDFILMRLQSDMEPRNDVLVRKIDSYSVQVPDGTTFPEQVTLNLTTESEVDKRG